jgi:predicted ArsR family transcriptional regulator
MGQHVDKKDFTGVKYMKSPTRQLVSLLADDVTGRLIGALRERPGTAPQLERETGAAQKTIVQTLELLHAHGIVAWQQSNSGQRGRPSKIWALAADERLSAFERSCDEFKAHLLRMQLDSYKRRGH